MDEKMFWKLFLDKNEKIAVNCETREEAMEFCDMMNNYGLKWSSGVVYNREQTFWNRSTFCYSNQGKRSDVNFYISIGHTVFKYSDIFINNLLSELL